LNTLLKRAVPSSVIDELKKTEMVKLKPIQNVGVLFCDIVSFTSYCFGRETEAVLETLNEIFSGFEGIINELGLYKVKTIGDAMMVTSGLLEPSPNPVLDLILCALRMIEIMIHHPSGLSIRVGVHYGNVYAGTMGKGNVFYDVWGDTVNIASRLEKLGLSNVVNCSKAVWDKVQEDVKGTSRGDLDVKGLGQLHMFQIEAILQERLTQRRHSVH